MIRQVVRQFLNNNKDNGKRILGLAATFSVLFGSMAPVGAAEIQLKNPTNRPAVRQIPTNVSFQPDLLLIMPDAKADSDEVKEALADVHGEVVSTLGSGRLQMLVVKTEKGHFLETEKKLTADKKHFAAVGRNYRFTANFVPNDPNFANSWHLTAMNATASTRGRRYFWAALLTRSTSKANLLHLMRWSARTRKLLAHISRKRNGKNC